MPHPDVTERLRSYLYDCSFEAADEIDILREHLAEAGYQLEAQDEMIRRLKVG